MRSFVQSAALRELVDDRREVEEAVGEVKGDDAAGFMCRGYTSSACAVMRWTGIASLGECVDHEDVELLRRLALEREARVAQHELDRRVAVLEEREVPLRDLDHGGIDVVEPEHVALGAVRRDRSRAEPDHARL